MRSLRSYLRGVGVWRRISDLLGRWLIVRMTTWWQGGSTTHLKRYQRMLTQCSLRPVVYLRSLRTPPRTVGKQLIKGRGELVGTVQWKGLQKFMCSLQAPGLHEERKGSAEWGQVEFLRSALRVWLKERWNHEALSFKTLHDCTSHP